MKKLLSLVALAFILSSCTSNTNPEKNKTINPVNSNTLVAYFSVTNNTKKIATYIQEYLQNDIFEIVPLEAYSQEDINYNSDCRANREQNDENARPKIKYTISDISKYDTIILGYPIWWGQAPKILYTFIESYDFSDKTIIPFCTSGSSPIGSSATNLAKKAPNANWLEGNRFSKNATEEEIRNWLDEYNIKKDNTMKMLIDEKELEVKWENNDSVKALKNILPLTIHMHEYGGFEQTGSIGTTIIKNDKQMDVIPGDIVLYNGNAISIFYNESSWSYTKLGHISLSKEELNDLLNKSSVTLTIK